MYLCLLFVATLTLYTKWDIYRERGVRVCVCVCVCFLPKLFVALEFP